jgi:NADH-quinone oxidoreductase subunit L
MTYLLIASAKGIEVQRWYPVAGKSWLFVGPPAQAASPAVFKMDFGIQVDNLTVVMLFVVTLVSFLVHLYSMGYMHGEVRYNRFFAYLGLFTFSMLGLCITSNLLYLFMFWELVGLCSYFLIGFYFEKKSAQNAAIKCS